MIRFLVILKVLVFSLGYISAQPPMGGGGGRAGGMGPGQPGGAFGNGLSFAGKAEVAIIRLPEISGLTANQKEKLSLALCSEREQLLSIESKKSELFHSHTSGMIPAAGPSGNFLIESSGEAAAIGGKPRGKNGQDPPLAAGGNMPPPQFSGDMRDNLPPVDKKTRKEIVKLDKKADKTTSKYDKKYRKILTPEQYTEFISVKNDVQFTEPMIRQNQMPVRPGGEGGMGGPGGMEGMGGRGGVIPGGMPGGGMMR